MIAVPPAGETLQLAPGVHGVAVLLLAPPSAPPSGTLHHPVPQVIVTSSEHA
jgi:hypothetical protein